eukprot:4061585-Alexandrium_andersonii.AAC.1
MAGEPHAQLQSAARLPGQQLVIQREVRLRGPGAPAKREVRAAEEDVCLGGTRHPRRALSQLMRCLLYTSDAADDM